MKYKEMQQTCSRYRKCDKCPLNCVDDWDVWQKGKLAHSTWCFMHLRERYENLYRMWIERERPDKAKQVMEEYVKAEQKYLKREIKK